ncbi:MAG: GNAT family N-acetyltransferase [bacterium]
MTVKTNSKFIVRNAGFTDAEGIYSLIKAYPKELLPRPISDIAENIDRFIVCEKNGHIVGTVSWSILPEIGHARHPSVEIKSLSVKSTQRKHGVGRMLVQAAVERIQVLKPSQLIVLTFTPGFFAKLGFREVPKASLMHKLYMGCINCAKYDSPFTCPEVAMAMDV